MLDINNVNLSINEDIGKYFKTEKLIILKTLRGLNFLSYIPASPQIPPTTLYEELQKYPLVIDFNRYFAIESLLNCMEIIFNFEVDENIKSYSTVKAVIDKILDSLRIFPEINSIIEDENTESYIFKTIDFADMIKIIYVNSFKLFKEDNLIFNKVVTQEDVENNIRLGTNDTSLEISKEKITVLYSLILLIDIIFDVSLKGKEEDKTIKLLNTTIVILDKFNFNPSKIKKDK